MGLNDVIDNNIPNLFLIGAPKSGTTAIANGLAQHAQIFVGKKEPRYFDANVFYDFEEDYPIKSISSYFQLYSGADKGHRYLLDASVFTMYSKESIKSILKLSPNARFIVVFRDPLQAVKSMHLQRLKYSDVKMREVSEDFCECWHVLQDRIRGHGYPAGCRNKFLFRYDLMYSYQLYVDMLLDTLGQENILFLNYDDFKVNYKYTYSKIFDFLKLDGFSIVNEKVNESSVLKSSHFNRFLVKGANFSRPIRDFIGLKGDKVQSLKKLLQVEKAAVRAESCDLEVESYFKDSYQTMKRLGHLYDWPSKDAF
jgi:hypothetical protein